VKDVRGAVLEHLGLRGEPRVEVVAARDDLDMARAVMQLLSAS
jgi:hypothetical protein